MRSAGGKQIKEWLLAMENRFQSEKLNERIRSEIINTDKADFDGFCQK